MAATLIARVTITDDDGTGTTGTIWNAAKLAEIYDDIDDLFKRTTAGDLTLELENTDVTATSDTGFIARVGSGAAGDAYYQALNGTVTYTWGLDNSDSDAFVLAASAALGTTNVLRATSAGVTIPGTLGVTGVVYINDTANANMTTGLTINQGAADDEILALKSSDVAHGMTTIAETDTFAILKKFSATAGGLSLRGLGSGTTGFFLEGDAATDDTTHTAAGTAYIGMRAQKTSGTGVTVPGANANLFIVDDGVGTRFIIDKEGDTFQDGTAGTAYATHDDPMLALALVHHFHPKRRVRQMFEKFCQYNKRDLVALGIIAPDDAQGNRGFVNMSALTRLNTGAVWQLGVRVRELAEAQRMMQRTLKRLAVEGV